MNNFNQHQYEPLPPPRRKRSLSTSRFDDISSTDTYLQQQSNFSLQQNRSNNNFSNNQANYINQQQQQHFINNRFNNKFSSNDHIPASYVDDQLVNYYNTNNPNNSRNQISVPQLILQQQQQQLQHHQRFLNPTKQQQQIPPQQSILFAAMAGSNYGSSRLHSNLHQHASNSYGPSTTDKTRHDFMKSSQYNPYQSKVNPTLMARPSLESYQSTRISPPILTAIATRRDPMYSSREHLNQTDSYGLSNDSHHVRFAQQKPARPPPPKLGSGSLTPSRLSVENLNLATGSNNYNNNHDYAVVDRNRRDRRSLSPSRVVNSSSGQRSYLGHRPTSPLPLTGLNTTTTSGRLTPSGSRTPNNQLSRSNSVANNLHQYRSYSRDHSREPSPMRSFFNFSPLSTSGYSSPSKGLLSPTKATGISRASFFGTPTSTTTTTTTTTFDNTQNRQNDGLLQANDYNFNSKRVNNNLTDANTTHTGENQQFSKQFTDHCDQYKSLTSKILGTSNRKNANRLSGEFNDGYLKDDTRQMMGHNNDVIVNDMMMNENFVSNNNNNMNNMNNMNMNDINLNQQIPSITTTTTTTQKTTDINNNNLTTSTTTTTNDMNSMEAQFVAKLNEKLHQEQLRRNSSSNNLQNYQRKASLPSEYINAANLDNLKLSADWSRENVAHLAHEARERKLRPPNPFKEKAKKVGVWFTKQIVFLMICGLNILLAYLFYNLVTVLPSN